MRQMIQRRICCVIFLHISLLWFIEGLSIYPASDLTLQSFTLVCDLQGAVLGNPVTFSYDGIPAGGCGSPPNPTCGSLVGTIVSDSQTVNLTLYQNEIPQIGNASWICEHGSSSPPFITNVIALCMNGKVTYKDEKIGISCSCGFPSVQAEVEYKDNDGKLLQNQTFSLGNPADSQCSSDNRSMDFSSYIENYPSETKEVCATLKTFSQISTPVKICAGCNYSDTELFFGGFSCFIIVLITTIIMLIILACKMLPKIFGDLSTKKKTIKIITIVVFIVVALIIGLALGFGFKECNQRNLGLGLGLGFLLAIALVVTLFIYHRQCDSKKENEDENRFSLDSCFRKCQVKPEKEMESPTEIQSKKPEDNHKRVGSPASASNVKMESKNKTDVLKGDQSALNQKVLHSPLPLPPLVNSQPPTASDDNSPVSRKKLDPIAVENEEANSSEKKKKKKKRKKKKNVDEAGNIGEEN